MPNREEAWKLLCEYTQSENLRKHALAVEACVRAYARKLGADPSTLRLGSLRLRSPVSVPIRIGTPESTNRTGQAGQAALPSAALPSAELSGIGPNSNRDTGLHKPDRASGTGGVNEELWGLAALLHDFDYERWPNEEHHPTQGHPCEGAGILREQGYPEELIRAILSHADYTGVARQTALEHTLFACDELAGFLTACALVKPNKSIFEVETASVKKKLKDKAFARGVNREDVVHGAEELGIPLDEHIELCIQAMRGVADQLGLRGAATP